MPYPVGLTQLADLYFQPDLLTGIFHCQIGHVWRFSKAFGSENYCLALSGEKRLETVFSASSKFRQ